MKRQAGLPGAQRRGQLAHASLAGREPARGRLNVYRGRDGVSLMAGASPDFVLEVDAKEGLLEGYAKPLFRDLRLLGPEEGLGPAYLAGFRRVLEEGVRIYSGDDVRRVGLERDLLGRYHDYKEVFERMHAERLRALAARGIPALMNSRTYPRTFSWEQVHESKPWYTKTGRLEFYRGEPEFVEAGENLSKIGAKYGISWQQIFDANRDIISDPDMIHPGQELKIPSA